MVYKCFTPLSVSMRTFKVWQLYKCLRASNIQYKVHKFITSSCFYMEMFRLGQKINCPLSVLNFTEPWQVDAIFTVWNIMQCDVAITMALALFDQIPLQHRAVNGAPWVFLLGQRCTTHPAAAVTDRRILWGSCSCPTQRSSKSLHVSVVIHYLLFNSCLQCHNTQKHMLWLKLFRNRQQFIEGWWDFQYLDGHHGLNKSHSTALQ